MTTTTTTRARLQELGLDALRDMAGQVDVDPEGLQKSKLIGAILDSEKFDTREVAPRAQETGRTGRRGQRVAK